VDYSSWPCLVVLTDGYIEALWKLVLHGLLPVWVAVRPFLLMVTRCCSVGSLNIAVVGAGSASLVVYHRYF
jgi:hypothetical protein